MTREYPEKLKWWIEMEDLSPRNFGRKTDFKTFAKDIELQKDWVFDQEGYFCQKDEGECTG